MPPLIDNPLRLWPRVAVLAAITAGAAACSSDVSRFESNPFATNSIAAKPTPPGSVASAGAPSGYVAGQPLPPPQAPMVAATGAAPSPLPPYQPAPLASAPPAHRLAAPPPVRIAGGTHEVRGGETLSSLGRLYGKSRTDIASANHLSPQANLHIGQRLVIPGTTQAQIDRTSRHAQAAAAEKPAPQQQAAAPAAAAPAAPRQVASAEPTVSANLASPTETPAAENDSHGGTPSFRWPVRGRVITGFGTKTGGQQNDGINISVPEGTSVKAAEDGVVAYSGNELKGYGNLVLVRHSGGYVTAYAHASEVLVKRGDRVKRGQIIARSGKTGSVAAPQLHFEIRKGSSPIDPMQFLRGAQAGL
jgi:murein DD-endopeptidase MepM/ murein hydrolase activator NlpD